MTVNIRVHDDTHVNLVRLKSFIQLKEGFEMSMGDFIDELLAKYPKQTLELDENDPLFFIEGPRQT
jgi:hypothetical protein